jgi:hypothetical protein
MPMWTTDPAETGERGAQGRFGRLARPAGQGRAVRCSCDRCGSHLLARPVGGGGLRGVCYVCGSESFAPLAPSSGPSSSTRSSPGSSSTGTPSRSAFSSLEPGDAPATT